VRRVAAATKTGARMAHKAQADVGPPARSEGNMDASPEGAARRARQSHRPPSRWAGARRWMFCADV